MYTETLMSELDLFIFIRQMLLQNFTIINFSLMFSSVTQSCPTLSYPMECGTPGLPVHHQLLEFTQTHVHRVGDTIQPSHPLLSPSLPALNLSQHQGLFKWVSSLHQVPKCWVSGSALVLPMNIQDSLMLINKFFL